MWDLLRNKYEVNTAYLTPSLHKLLTNEYFTALCIKTKKITCKDTLIMMMMMMMIAKAIATGWQLVICDKNILYMCNCWF